MLGFARTLLRLLRKKRFSYTPLIEIRIRKDAIIHNLNAFRERGRDVAVAPVLKSNAYGHGLVEVARILNGEDLPFFCVDSYFEALILRNENIRTPLLIIGYTPVETMLESRLADVAFGIIGFEELRSLAALARSPIAIHLKVDTGMHRHGIQPSELGDACMLIRANKHIVLEGVYSHLADADTPDSEHVKMQIAGWNEMAARTRKEFPHIKYFHLAATTGSFYAQQIDANVMRLGIGLYGINVSLGTLDLHPALEMRTRITSIHTLHAGESVGYNATFTASRDTRIATIPAGYAEGVDRRLSNKGPITVRGTPCPIVGRVSMNITSLDISNVANVRVGDEAVVISSSAADGNGVEKIAKLCGTIPYEILVHIPAHLRRVVV
ncbi:MAG: alanine racemase [Patescibacteria group bacterium]